MSQASCRLLIADDHQMLAQGLAALLADVADIHVVGRCATGQALLTWLQQTPAAADVLLLDVHLPDANGLALLPELRRRWPALRILVFSMTSAADAAGRAAALGAHGFIAKTAEATDLLDAIRRVGAGEVLPVAPGGEVSAGPAARLSERERQVIRLIRDGLGSKQVADALGLSNLTVDTHRKNILHKLALPNVAALVRFALQHDV